VRHEPACPDAAHPSSTMRNRPGAGRCQPHLKGIHFSPRSGRCRSTCSRSGRTDAHAHDERRYQ
jgi:hypothetical protein